MAVTSGQTIKIFTNNTATGRIVGYDSNKAFLKVVSTGVTGGSTGATITIDFTGYIRIAVLLTAKANTQIVDSAIYNGSFSPYGYLGSDNVMAIPKDSSITPAKLTEAYNHKGRLTAANNDDLNNIYKSGTYYAVDCLNRPNTTDSFHVIVYYLDSRYAVQMAVKRNDATQVYMRSRDTTVPSSYTTWQKMSIGNITNTNLDPAYDYVGTLSVEDLNTITRSGAYVATAGLPNRPPEAINSSAYIRVVNYGSSYLQEYMQYSDATKIWRRIIQPSSSSFGAWYPVNTSKASSVLANKTIVCFGDSITARGYYQQNITAKTAMIAPNVGFGGTRMAFHTDPNYDAFSMCRLADAIVSGDWSAQDAAAPLIADEAPLATLKGINFSTVDCISFFYGTNDFSGGINIGSITDVNKTTFYGAYNYTLDKLLTEFPSLKIVLFTPMFRNVVGSIDGNNSDDYPNGDGVYLKEYADAVVAIAKKWHIPCYSMYDNSGINKYNANTYLSDNLHPNALGGDFIGRRMAGFINANI
jgi:lysophospholipase L1-like esterase